MSASACAPVMTVTNLAGATSPPSAATLPSYPWARDTTLGNDPYGLTMRQCVSYAAWYLNTHGATFGYLTKGPKGVATFGDAKTWRAAALIAGFTVSSKPLVGSVAQWVSHEGTSFVAGGTNVTAGSAGHVAIVTRVYANGNIDIAQYNLTVNRGYSVTLNTRAPRYIYVPLVSPRVP